MKVESVRNDLCFVFWLVNFHCKVYSHLQVDGSNKNVALIKGISTTSITIRWWNSSQGKRRGNIDKSQGMFGILVAFTRNFRPHLQFENQHTFLHNVALSNQKYAEKFTVMETVRLELQNHDVYPWEAKKQRLSLQRLGQQTVIFKGTT